MQTLASRTEALRGAIKRCDTSKQQGHSRARPRLGQARLEDILWQLRGLATARLADEDNCGVLPDQSQELEASFCNGQAPWHCGTPHRACLHHAELGLMSHDL